MSKENFENSITSVFVLFSPTRIIKYFARKSGRKGIAMFEFGLGVILAVLFVTAYLLITSFFQRQRPEIGPRHRNVSLNPMDSSHALEDGRSRKVLASGEPGETNSSRTKDRSGEDGGSTR